MQQHLAWLDTEIAAASGDTPASPPPPRPATAPTPAAPDPEAILRQFHVDSGAAQTRAKLGCWAAFAGTFLLLGLGIALWLVLRAR